MDRVKFSKGSQRKFIERACKGESLKGFLNRNKLKISYSSLKSYHNESLLLPMNIFEELCEIAGINKDEFSIELLSGNWGASKGGKLGYKMLAESHDKSTLDKWRRLGGKNCRIGERSIKKIAIPTRITEELAELVGAHLGNGTLSRYFIRISGDSRYDLDYFKYLSSIIKSTFGLEASIKRVPNKNTLCLEVRSKILCDFFHNSLNIPYGDKIKNNASIPNDILDNKRLSKACLRGLMDTDGSTSKRGSYLCLAFNSRNKTIYNQVRDINKRLGIFTHQYGDEIGTNSWKHILRFYKTIGSSNKRSIVSFCERYHNNNLLYKEDITRYFNKYKNIKLPYRVNGPVV